MNVPSAVGTPPHILLVDDEEGIVEISRYRMQKLGYKVSAHTSSSQALADFREQPDRYHAVVTDLSMPDINGMDLARQLRTVRADIPIILCTGDCSAYSEEEIRASGIDRILLKPVPTQSLADLLALMLD